MAGFDLSAMLADVPNLGTDADTIQRIPMEDILDDPQNFYSIDGLEELAANIETVGLQQPILVRPAEEKGKYIIVSGHRRRSACRDILGYNDMRCMVTTVTGSPELMELSLIYANANTRTLSAADLSKQAERVTELLYKLKEQGYEFPGRMREHVAKAVGISKSKLGRLEVIRKGLFSDFRPAWDAGKLNENTAYTLAQLPSDVQYMIHAEQTNGGKRPFACTAGHVERLAREIERAKKSCQNAVHPECPRCKHEYVRIQKAARLGDLCGIDCSGCCCSCYALHRCKDSCPTAAAEKKMQKETEAAAKRRSADEAAAKAKPKIDLLTGIFQRIGEARRDTGLDGGRLTEIVKGWSCVDDSAELEKHEAGEGITDQTYIMGIYVNDLLKILRLADTLGVSIDWLLGRKLPEKTSGNAWQTGEPPEPGCYVLAYRDVCGTGVCEYDYVRYDEKRGWLLYGSEIADVGIQAVAWIRTPEV